jgi:hypothetical protein
MKTIIIFLLVFFIWSSCDAQSPVGRWKKISHISSYEGQTFDSYKALLTQRPCAAKIVYEINVDETYRLNASASGCDEKYKKIQEKLYSESKWKVEGNKITISSNDFIVGQSYIITYSSNKMIWKGTDGQGTITYQKL